MINSPATTTLAIAVLPIGYIIVKVRQHKFERAARVREVEL
jgi:hypothetical protein